jgi:hypothetical protein
VRRIELFNQHIGADKRKVPRKGESGDVVYEDEWCIIYTDRASGDQIMACFPRDVRDEVVKQLTGGIVLAGGELPRL